MDVVLNDRQLRFCRLMVQGELNNEQCYAKAYGRAIDGSTRANASRLLKNANIVIEIARLRSLVDADAVMSLEYKRKLLKRMVEARPDEVDGGSELAQEVVSDKEGGERVRLPDKLRAIDLDSKLAGHYAPTAVEVGGLSEIAALLGQMEEEPLV